MLTVLFEPRASAAISNEEDFWGVNFLLGSAHYSTHRNVVSCLTRVKERLGSVKNFAYGAEGWALALN